MEPQLANPERRTLAVVAFSEVGLPEFRAPSEIGAIRLGQ